MNFSDRLDLAMKEAGHTQGSLAKAVGMAQSSVWKLVSGGAKGSRKLVDIARVLGVRPEWLSDGSEPMREHGARVHHLESTIPPESEWEPVDAWDSRTPLMDDEVEIPFLRDIELAAGDGSYNEDDYNGFKLRFSKATLRRVGADSNGDGVLCFPARGNSMEPIIPDGTTVAVDTNNKKIIDGNIFAINHGGLKRIKQLYRLPNNRVSVRSFNKDDHPDQEADLSDVEVIGRVFWYSVLL